MRAVLLSLLLLLICIAFVFGYSAFLGARLASLAAQAQALPCAPEAVAALQARFERLHPYLLLATPWEELFAIQDLLVSLSVWSEIPNEEAFSLTRAQLLLCLTELRADQSLSLRAFL